MNGSSSGLTNGTPGTQQSMEQTELKSIVESNENTAALRGRSPITIPPSATEKVEKKNGYDQVKYTWNRGEYTYTSRWHTRTPNAPKEQGNSWVVERKKSGVGHGKNARPKQEEVLVGKNKWISKQEWKDAIIARKKGTLTKKQKEWLDNGHWKDNQ